MKIKAEFEKDEIEFTGELAKYNNKKLEIKNGEEASAIYESLNKEFEITNVKKTTKKRESKPPLLHLLYNRKLHLNLVIKQEEQCQLLKNFMRG